MLILIVPKCLLKKSVRKCREFSCAKLFFLLRLNKKLTCLPAPLDKHACNHKDTLERHGGNWRTILRIVPWRMCANKPVVWLLDLLSNKQRRSANVSCMIAFNLLLDKSCLSNPRICRILSKIDRMYNIFFLSCTNGTISWWQPCRWDYKHKSIVTGR